jgi:predicted dehydrogenase
MVSPYRNGTTIHHVTGIRTTPISRALVVGGGIGLRHLNNLRTILPETDIRLLTSHSHLEEEYRGTELVEDLNAAKRFNPEITIVANPASLHSRVVSYLAPTGTAFFIEKPLAASLQDALIIQNACKLYSSFVLIGYNLRFANSLKFLKEFIDSQEYGQVVTVQADVGQDLRTWRLNKDYRKSVSAQSFLGGGVLLELSHEIDYLTWIFGDLHHVHSLTGSVGNLDVDVEDFAFIHFTTSSQIPISLNMDFFRSGKTRQCVIVCSNGTLKWDGIAGSVSRLLNDGTWELIKFWREDLSGTYAKEMKYFVDCVSASTTPLCNIDTAINTLKIIEKIKSEAEVLKRDYD